MIGRLGRSLRRPAPGGRGSRALRLLDQTVAVALLWALGSVRRKRMRPGAPSRIGVMKSTGIGDMILATAIIRDLVAAFPGVEIVVFAGADNADLARSIPEVRVVELRTAKPWSVIPQLRAERLDVLIDLGQWSRLEALYAALSGARWTAGFDTAGQRRHYAYDATVEHAGDVRELENFQRLVAPLGVVSQSRPRFEVTGAPTAPPTSERYAVFHLWPGGFRSELREWPAESWRELAFRVREDGLAIVLTGGPADVDRTDAFVRSCGESAGEVLSVAGRYRVGELVGLLADSQFVVSVNTGVMHLAAATGAPTVGLNGPTSSVRWGPIGPRAISVDSDLPGCGFLDLGFEYDGQRTDCMRGITVDRVVAAIHEAARG